MLTEPASPAFWAGMLTEPVSPAFWASMLTELLSPAFRAGMLTEPASPAFWAGVGALIGIELAIKCLCIHAPANYGVVHLVLVFL